MTTSPDKPTSLKYKPTPKVTEPSYTGLVFMYDRLGDLDRTYECMPAKCIGTMEYSTPDGGIYQCDVILTKYPATKQNRLVLIDSTYGEPIAEASEPLDISYSVRCLLTEGDWVTIKDHSENEGILEQLIANNMIMRREIKHVTGIYTNVYICKLVLDTPAVPSLQQELPL